MSHQILICGGRDWRDAARIRSVLREYAHLRPMILHGNAPGADSYAADEAARMGLRVKAYPADWARYGAAAGPIRNREMLDANPDLVIAFGGGKGTADTVLEAKYRAIPVREVA